MIRKFVYMIGFVLFILALQTVVTCRNPGPTPEPVPAVQSVPSASQEVDKAKAWTEACRLAFASEAEKAKWTRPETTIYPKARWNIMGNGLPNRLCGQIEVFYVEPDLTGDNIDQYVSVFIRPVEPKLLANVLTHEYLHAIWFNRAFNDDAWHAAHPDSEQYVVSLIPNICPPI